MSKRRRRSEPARLLGRARVPDAAGAEERAWRVVSAAYAEREATAALPAARRRFALALAGGLAIAAIALSPAGAEVGELVTETLGIDSDQALPELRRLPAPGELLVETPDGGWVVRADGSKRLLGGYDDVSWSPRGLYIAAAAGNELVALEPNGDVRWTVPADAPVRDPRWGGSGIDTRIAFRSGGDLWAIAGDGTGARLVARDVAPAAPAWLPAPPKAKVVPGVSRHLLAYVDGDRVIHVVDVDSGRSVEPKPEQRLRLRALRTGAAVAPTADRLAFVADRSRGSALVVAEGGRREVLFAGPGRFTDPTWSPDGRWILIGWREADQWLFIRSEPRADAGGGRSRVVAIDAVTRSFDPGGTGSGEFPLPAGWVLPDR